MSHLRSAIKFILFLLCTILCLITSIFTYNFWREGHEKLIKLYLLTVLKIFNVKVEEDKSEKLPDDAVLYVSNHTSYLDVIVLGSRISVRFTPKIEVSRWPIMNILVNLSLPVYIDRNIQKSLEQKQTIREIIDNGDSIMIFPEATTNDGTKVLPFKSSLFSVAEPDENKQQNVKVQPISIVYTHIDGEPATDDNIDKISWYGDMKFLPHFWSLLGAKGATVKIIYHPGVTYEDFGNRKELSKHCENIITAGINEIKNGG